MEEYNLKISDAAQTDLNNHFDYIANSLFNEIAATNLMKEIYNAMELLKTFPYSGTEIPEEQGLRKLLVKNYFIIYEVDDSEKSIHILHIYYAKSDYLSYL